MPISVALCRTLADLSRQTWFDIRDSRAKGLPIGEDSITDFLLLDLTRRCPGQVQVRRFNRVEEGRKTGADWEWWFVEGGRGFGIRFQAKLIDRSCTKYTQLDRVTPETGRKQINLLISDARDSRHPCSPMYIFYNYWPPSKPGAPWRCDRPRDDELLGCSIANALAVRRRLPDNSVSGIGSDSLPLSCLACCDMRKGAIRFPAIARGVASSLAGRGKRSGWTRSVPRITRSLPRYVRDLLDNREVQADAGLPEPPDPRLAGVLLSAAPGSKVEPRPHRDRPPLPD